MTDVRPEYERELVTAIRRSVSSGDDVTIIGGGWGVSTVVAARLVGSTGSVTTYEGGAEQVKHVRETVRLNCVPDRVTLNHAVVGKAKRVFSEQAEVVVDPGDLSDTDVLILDCEGAEVDILDGMDIRPSTVVVEAHPMYDAPCRVVRKVLEDIGYEIVGSEEEETPSGTITILVASRPS
jgi:tRNA A58 N-methylase Trm61